MPLHFLSLKPSLVSYAKTITLLRSHFCVSTLCSWERTYWNSFEHSEVNWYHQISTKSNYTIRKHLLCGRFVIGEPEDGWLSGEKYFSCYPPLNVRVASLTPSNAFLAAHPTVRKHENFPANTTFIVPASCLMQFLLKMKFANLSRRLYARSERSRACYGKENTETASATEREDRLCFFHWQL